MKWDNKQECLRKELERSNFLLWRGGVRDEDTGARAHPGAGHDVILIWAEELALLQDADVPPLGQLLLPLGLPDLQVSSLVELCLISRSITVRTL